MLRRVKMGFWLAEGTDGTGVTHVEDLLTNGSQKPEDQHDPSGDDE